VESVVARVNQRWGDRTWEPIHLEVSNDRARAIAALRRFDVLLVNSVRDGMNLVAVEGALANERDGVIVLSRQAGAAERLAGSVMLVDPFDVDVTTDALDRALRLPVTERVRMATRARHAIFDLRADHWLQALLDGGAQAEPAEV
jgi:trehalose 6-phosphate synthase